MSEYYSYEYQPVEQPVQKPAAKPISFGAALTSTLMGGGSILLLLITIIITACMFNEFSYRDEEMAAMIGAWITLVPSAVAAVALIFGLNGSKNPENNAANILGLVGKITALVGLGLSVIFSIIMLITFSVYIL